MTDPDQFIVYRVLDAKNRPGKTDKIPTAPSGRVTIDPHLPAHWMTREAATAAAARLGRGYGVGFVIAEADDYWFIDIDECRSGDGWSDAAVMLCNRLPGAYVEVSVSGRGLHIIGRGRVPPHGTKCPALGADLYSKLRFCALTGTGARGDMDADLPAAIHAIAAEHFPPGSASIPSDWTEGPCEGYGGPSDDDDLIRIACAAQSAAAAFGGKPSFKHLWEADAEALSKHFPDDHGDRPYDASRADAALAQHLAFWTGRDCGRIRRLMERSALRRDKWENREDYLPRTITAACGQQQTVATGSRPSPAAPGAVTDESAQPFSDDALARSFSDTHTGRLVFVPSWSRWLCWEKHRWVFDDTLAVFDRVRTLCREKATQIEGSNGKRVASAQTIAAVERLARSDPRHARRPDDFDADAWALNTPDGVVDLKTGKLRHHGDGEMLTKVAGAIPGGDCPRWRRFLAEITKDDADLISYIQKWVGYSLTGDTREQALIFVCGPGGNGKSVLLNTVAAILGDYAKTAMADVFTANRSEQHPTHVASLLGARMVNVTETEEGHAWAESRIKSLTGGDKISARFMRGDPFEFQPQFKLWIAGNHRPVLNNPDPAMRRRLHLVPLTFVPKQPDQQLQATLRAELPGILAWAVEGCLAWQREGLVMPAIVRATVEDYFAEQDTLSAWLAKRCDVSPDATTPSRALFEDWRRYAATRGEAQRTEKWFSEGLQRHYPKKRTNAGVVFVGVLLKSPV